MNKPYVGLTFSALIALILFLPAAAKSIDASDTPDAMEWNFRVYLDDSEIGYHNFRLTRQDDQKRLITEAKFKVKVLFFTAYKYQHFNAETWQGNCLQEIESRTVANGEKFSVRGSQGPENFEIEASGERSQVPGCVMTFAYWNPDFLNESALLNSQTGELTPVSVEALDEETLTIKGLSVDARKYRLAAKDINLEVWYSKDRRWLGLESTTESGRKLRYVLT